MKLGVNAVLWTQHWTDASVRFVESATEFGLDFIEIPLVYVDDVHPEVIRPRLQRSGIEAITSTVLTEDTDITSPDPEVRAAGVAYMRHCVDVTAAMGGVQFSGVIYGMHRKRPSGRPALQDWQWSAECLSAVADHAAAEGVRLALEPCNRYETPLINTCEQATRLIQMVGRENVGIHLDTYHMNVEERSWTDPVLLAGSRLFHIHLCENDRGIPGSGHVDWNALFHALALIHYRGYAGLEAFVNVSPEMVASRCVWRDVASSPDVYIREGVAFVREFARLYNI